MFGAAKRKTSNQKQEKDRIREKPKKSQESEVLVCRDCGAPLTADSKRGLCSECLQKRKLKRKKYLNTAIKIIGVVGAAVGAVLLASKAASDSDTDTDNTEPERDGEDSTPKYKLRVTYPDGTVEDEDEIFDSVDAANDYGEYVLACSREGAEILNMSNPGDYPLDDYMDPDYEVVEVE